MRDSRVAKYRKTPVAVVDQDGIERYRFANEEECMKEMLFPERSFWFVLNREFKQANNQREQQEHEQIHLTIHGWQLFYVNEFPDGKYPTCKTFGIIHKDLENYLNNSTTKFDDLLNENLEKIDAEIMKDKLAPQNVPLPKLEDLEFEEKVFYITPPVLKETNKVVVYKPESMDELKSNSLW